MFLPVYNKDTRYFSDIIGSMARDLSAFIIQSNNSEYGDSRISGPMTTDYKEIVQLKGGENIFVVLGALEIDSMKSKHRELFCIEKDIDILYAYEEKEARKKRNKEITERIEKSKRLITNDNKKKESGKFKPLSAGSDYKDRWENDLE